MARRRGQSTGVQRTQAQTTDEQRDRLRDISNNDESAIAELVSIRLTEAVDTSGLDGKTFALANIAALIATGGDDASYSSTSVPLWTRGHRLTRSLVC
jgi:alkylhydroperoxidase/carboxymuconolactone decarboxylase family protein YurZ